MNLSRRNALALGAAGLAGAALNIGVGARAWAEENEMAEPDYIETGSGTISIYPIAHASLALAAPGLTIYSDPVGDVAAYDGLPSADLILVTHEHGDHFNTDTLTGLMQAHTRLVTNPAVFGKLPETLKARAEQIGNGQSTEVMDITIDAIPAYNTTPDRLNYHPEGRDNGYVLTIGAARIYIAGDTEDIPEMRALTGIDLAFVPMNLPYTMDVDQAADGVIAFAPKVIYPYHYRGSDIERFKALVDAAGKPIEVRFGEWY